jgi:hypothetical protein
LENTFTVIFYLFIFDVLTPLSAIFQLYHGDQFNGGRSQITRREPPTMGKQLVSFVTCGSKSSDPFSLLTKPGANPRHIGYKLV